MGGPSDSYNRAQQRQEQISDRELALAERQQSFSEEDRAQRQVLMQPAINKYRHLAGGDREGAVRAMAPQLGEIASGFAAAKNNIMNMPAGALRDAALMDLTRQKDTATGAMLAQASAAAPDVLANIGSGLGAFSLQELGASLRGFEGSASTSQAIAQEENQRKAQQLEFMGGLAGTAGGLAGTMAGMPWKKNR